MLLGACSQRPGITPTEQEALTVVEAAVEGPMLLTLEKPSYELAELQLVLREFTRLPIVARIVWQCAETPSNDWLAKLSGRNIRQYWDRQRKTPSTGGRLALNGKLIPLERVMLRVAIAQHSVKTN